MLKLPKNMDIPKLIEHLRDFFIVARKEHHKKTVLALPITVILFTEGDWPKFYLVLTGDLVDFNYKEYLPKIPHGESASYGYRTISKTKAKEEVKCPEEDAVPKSTYGNYDEEKVTFKRNPTPVDKNPKIRTVT